MTSDPWEDDEEPVYIATGATNWQDRAWGAVDDLRRGLDLRQSWIYLALSDTKYSSRRTRIGPLWNTLGFAILVLVIGFVWSRMSTMGPDKFFPYFSSGMFVFQFLSMVAVNGFGCFIFGGGYVSNSALPLSFFVFWHYSKLLFMMALQLPVVIVIYLIYGWGLEPRFIEAAFALIAVVAVCVTYGFSFGLLFARYRDLLEVSRSSLRFLFILTPIIWAPEDLFNRFRAVTGGEPSLFLTLFTMTLNPVFHMIQVFRAPMMGQAFPATSWLFLFLMQIVGIGLFFVLFARFRTRIVYWV